MSFVTAEAAESIPSATRFRSTTSSYLPGVDAMKTIEVMRIGPVIPVIVVDDLAQAVPLARALVAGGVRVLEVTLRTPVALDAIRRDGLLASRARSSASARSRAPRTSRRRRPRGAVFGVSPGLTPALIDAATRSGLPLLPGVMTPSDVIAARAAGYTELKLFPGAAGRRHRHAEGDRQRLFRRDVLPDRRVYGETAPDFLALSNVACVGGSWLTPKDAVAIGRLATHHRTRARRFGAACASMNPSENSRVSTHVQGRPVAPRRIAVEQGETLHRLGRRRPDRAGNEGSEAGCGAACRGRASRSTSRSRRC
jgi:2-dehydro-3-deoxyphosphogluconate aldolase/(4S)-4-hydroxy-2-oxoglutarate aldolase